MEREVILYRVFRTKIIHDSDGPKEVKEERMFFNCNWGNPYCFSWRIWRKK